MIFILYMLGIVLGIRDIGLWKISNLFYKVKKVKRDKILLDNVKYFEEMC